MENNLWRYLKTFLAATIVLILTLGIISNSAPVKAASPSAPASFTVTAHKLPAKVVKANGTEALLLADAPIVLSYGDKIVVGKGGRVELYYGTGLSVEAWQGAELVLSGVSANQVNLLLLVGQIHAVVPPNSKNKIQLTTTYQVLTTTVDDTEFIICHDPNTKKLTCNDVRRGEVEIEANGVVSTLKGKYGAYTLEGKPMSEPICEHVDELDNWVVQTRNAENVPPLGALVGRWYNEGCPITGTEIYVSAQSLPAKIIKAAGGETALQANVPALISSGDKVTVGSGGQIELRSGKTTANTSQPSGDLAAKMKNAKILVFEDTASIGYWVKDALDQMKLSYTHDGDAQGRFLTHLKSDTKWDLIIVAGEARNGVQGEFWDAISNQVNNNGSALIAETWYLDSIYNGKVKPLLDQCGVGYQGNIDLAQSLYLLDPSHPLATMPNKDFSLEHFTRYWAQNDGDQIKLIGGDAKLIFGLHADNTTTNGTVATCLNGRMVVQTFSNHDYHKEDVIALWQNYITWVLTNRFK